jgi:hypothetical protein
MSRLVTVLVIAAVVLIGAFATADALRDHEPEPSASRRVETTTAGTAVPSEIKTLREVDVIGTLLYSDERCALHSLILPELVDQPVRGEDERPVVRCRFEAGGGQLLRDGDRISPDNRFVAGCSGGRVEVRELETGRDLRSYRGCPPAWRPDGRLTYPRGDRIMEGSRMLVSAQKLREAASTNPNVGTLGSGVRVFVHAIDLIWVGEALLVASLEIRARYIAPQFVTVAFLDGKLVESSRFGQGTGQWVASPAGSFAAAEDASLVTRDADFIEPPDNLPAGRAVAFSPDERWLAYVTGRSIYLIGTPANEEPGRVIRIARPARDLVWQLS